ncbi:hypothetical protein WR25_15023 [Diploscapter pachys]|uniref:Uncharacterized protein n=1 Tax=Diploscapter pachys TaxID=2018661 RepID=A0A2A2JAA0_9BILA|nr:hypothetical protein WR25_15023 [Diploscapter pachys]
MPRPRKARPNILEVRRREASEESNSSNDNDNELTSADDHGGVVDDVQPVIRDDPMNEGNSDDDMSLTRSLSTNMSQFIRKRQTHGPKIGEPKQKSSRFSTEKPSIGLEPDRSSTSAFLTTSPSPTPAIQQILGVGNSVADELNENLIGDDSGYEPSPHAARLLKSLKKEVVTRITKNRRKKVKSGEMKMIDPVKLAKEFLFTISGQRVAYASVVVFFLLLFDNVDDQLRQRLPIDIDAIAVLAEKARNPETAEMFLALAGVCMILNRELKRIENRTKERTDKARPKETEFYTAQVVDESAIKALGPLSTPIHTCSSDEADIAPAALSKGLPNSIAMTDVISKITQNVLHTVCINQIFEH